MTIKQKIKETIIKNVVDKLCGKDTLAAAFSGSLDSTLVAYIALKHTNITTINLYTIGTQNCYDFKVAGQTCKFLRESFREKTVNFKKINLKDKNVFEYNKTYKKLTRDKNKVSTSFTLPFFILLDDISQKHVLSGHGADTVFGGFYKYMKTKDLKNYLEANFQQFLTDLKWRERRIAEFYSKELILPFADLELLELVLKLPNQKLTHKNKRKIILREIAFEIGLSEQIVNLPKKAFQYSSGILKILRKNNY